MPDVEGIIGIIISLFLVFLLGYVFFQVLLQVSPIFAVLFLLAMGLIVIGIILGIFRRE